MRRTLPVAALAALLLLAAPAGAVTKNGITPVTPKAGDTIPSGRAFVFKLNVKGPSAGTFVQVCKSKRRDADGIICSKAAIGKAKHKQGSRYEYKAKFYDFPGFWLNSPGTYYWQAYRTHCDAGISDCKAEGPIVKFKVG